MVRHLRARAGLRKPGDSTKDAGQRTARENRRNLSLVRFPQSNVAGQSNGDGGGLGSATGFRRRNFEGDRAGTLVLSAAFFAWNPPVCGRAAEVDMVRRRCHHSCHGSRRRDAERHRTAHCQGTVAHFSEPCGQALRSNLLLYRQQQLWGSRSEAW